MNNNFINENKYAIPKINPMSKVKKSNNQNNHNKYKNHSSNKSFDAILEEEIRKNSEKEKEYCKKIIR